LEEKKIEKFEIFMGNFPHPNQRWLTRPDLTRVTKYSPDLATYYLLIFQDSVKIPDIENLVSLFLLNLREVVCDDLHGAKIR